MKQLLFTAIFSMVCLCSYAQELKIVSFQRDLLGLKSKNQLEVRTDAHGTPCAIVRVSVKNAQAYFFKDAYVVGDVVYYPGEVWVYMAEGARNLTITSDKFGTLRYTFPQELEKEADYRLTLKLIEDENNKNRTVVAPVMGIGKISSYGIMVGVVKKTGGYLKVKYNFQNLSADYECDSSGYIAETGATPWYSGAKQYSRMAITGGILQRVAKPIYVYGGIGYGVKRVGWQLQDGKWAENMANSYKGYEMDLGGIVRVKNIALSAGVQTNQFKYWEGTLGIGIMF